MVKLKLPINRENLSPYQQSKARQSKQKGSLSNRHPKWSLRNLSPESSYHRATSSLSTHQDPSRRNSKHHVLKQSNSTSKKSPYKTNYKSITTKRSSISNPTFISKTSVVRVQDNTSSQVHHTRN
ncbi:hypothetical protein Dimus_039271 [Dionaea muscipula]